MTTAYAAGLPQTLPLSGPVAAGAGVLLARLAARPRWGRPLAVGLCLAAGLMALDRFVLVARVRRVRVAPRALRSGRLGIRPM